MRLNDCHPFSAQIIKLKAEIVEKYGRHSLPFLFLLLWTFISIGRPQDLFPIVQSIRPGIIAAVGTSLFYLLFSRARDLNSNILQYIEVKIVLALFLLMFLLVPFATVKSDSLDYILTIYIKVLIFYLFLIKLVKYPSQIKLLTNVLFFGALCLSIEVIRISSSISGRLSVGTNYDPNDLASVIVAMSSIPLILAFHSRGLRKILYLFLFGIMVLAITLTQSRGGTLGLLTVLILVFLDKKRFKLDFLCCICFLLLILAHLAPQAYLDRVKSIDLKSQDVGSGRMIIWKRSLKIIHDNPFGVGVNCFTSTYGRYVSSGEVKKSNWYRSGKWVTAHNSFILIAVELGLIGLALFLFLIYRGIVNFRSVREIVSENSILYIYAEIYKVGLIGYIVTIFFLSSSYSVLLLFMIAMSLCLRKMAENKILKEHESYS